MNDHVQTWAMRTPVTNRRRRRPPRLQTRFARVALTPLKVARDPASLLPRGVAHAAWLRRDAPR
ncbi:MAG: hypothetical protein H0U19_15190 [Acidobacteria bacterium]|nr:hypothetical protein [Acidobacteriota bacterium]